MWKWTSREFSFPIGRLGLSTGTIHLSLTKFATDAIAVAFGITCIPPPARQGVTGNDDPGPKTDWADFPFLLINWEGMQDIFRMDPLPLQIHHHGVKLTTGFEKSEKRGIQYLTLRRTNLVTSYTPLAKLSCIVS